MFKQEVVTVIRERVDSAAALRDVAGMADEVPVCVEGSVLYPYIRFAARCTVRTMLGSKDLSVDCLVDGINGIGATADAFSVEQANSNDEKCLQPGIAREEAQRIAERTVTYGLARQLKMLAPFDVRLEAAGTVFKRFWIVRIGAGRIMTDSVTGNMHPLRASAA